MLARIEPDWGESAQAEPDDALDQTRSINAPTGERANRQCRRAVGRAVPMVLPVADDRNAGEIAACQRDELAYVRHQDMRKVGVLVVVLKEGTPIEVRTQILGVDAKCLHVYRTLHVAGTDPVLAANEQMLLNVDMSGPRAAPFAPSVWPRVQALAEQHRGMPRPKYAGRSIALPG